MGYNPVLLLEPGDLCNSSSYSVWKSEFFLSNELSLINKTPWVNGPGNHEASGTTTKAFTQGTNGDKLYFSFDYGDIHFIVLDTNDEASLAPSAACSTTGPITTWPPPRKPWKIAVYHKTAYVAGGHGENATMKTVSTNIFVPRGVQMVLNGHSHFYQRNYCERHLSHPARHRRGFDWTRWAARPTSKSRSGTTASASST